MVYGRKKRPLDQRKVGFRDARLIIIATEGRLTEKQYFALFKKSNIQVIVLESADNKSAPEYVKDRLSRFQKEFDLDESDELWLMIDVDRWGDKKLKIVAADSTRRGFGLAVSNPCFELWLYLHHDTDISNISNCQELKECLRVKLGQYNSSNIRVSDFISHIKTAIKNSKSITNDSERWPSFIGTHVYRVVEKLV